MPTAIEESVIIRASQIEGISIGVGPKVEASYSLSLVITDHHRNAFDLFLVLYAFVPFVGDMIPLRVVWRLMAFFNVARTCHAGSCVIQNRLVEGCSFQGKEGIIHPLLTLPVLCKKSTSFSAENIGSSLFYIYYTALIRISRPNQYTNDGGQNLHVK